VTDTYVGALAYALGDVEATVEESAAAGRFASELDDLIDAGFRRHRICGEGVTAYDLAKRCAGDVPADVAGTGAIVYATCLPANGNIGDASDFAATGEVKYLMDFPASRLQADLGLPEASVIGLNQQACTGMLGSLRVARALLHAEPDIDQVLCLTADRFPSGSLYEQTYNVISDGAAACVVSRTPQSFKLLACHQVTNGALAQVTDDEVVGSYFSYTHQVITAALAKAGLQAADVDWVVPQNTNFRAWQILARLLGLDFRRVWFPSMADIGHVISADNIVNLRDLEQSGRVRRGDRLLLLMAGYGMNWQCTILEKT
jgi:3-oxoacyl-[acyl-carrier-protein] synthase III